MNQLNNIIEALDRVTRNFNFACSMELYNRRTARALDHIIEYTEQLNGEKERIIKNMAAINGEQVVGDVKFVLTGLSTYQRHRIIRMAVTYTDDIDEIGRVPLYVITETLHTESAEAVGLYDLTII